MVHFLAPSIQTTSPHQSKHFKTPAGVTMVEVDWAENNPRLPLLFQWNEGIRAVG